MIKCLRIVAFLIAWVIALPNVYSQSNLDISQLPPLMKSRLGNPLSYEVNGQEYNVLQDARGYKKRGIASWYGPKFHGKPTSSGEIYNMYAMTAASKTLPLPIYAKVTNLENGRQIIVKVNDRGPFHPGRIIDLSYAAAHRLGILKHGTAQVEVEALISTASHIKQRQRQAFLQLGAFSDPANARSLMMQVKQIIQQPISIRHSYVRSKQIFHVLIGPIINRDTNEHVTNLLEMVGFGRPYPVMY